MLKKTNHNHSLSAVSIDSTQALRQEHLFSEILSKYSELIEKRVQKICRKNYDGKITFDDLLSDCQSRLWQKFKSGYLTLQLEDAQVNRLITHIIADILRETYGDNQQKQRIKKALPFSVIDEEGNSFSATIRQKETHQPRERLPKAFKLKSEILKLLERNDVKLTKSQVTLLKAKIEAIDALGDNATPKRVNNWVQNKLGISYTALQTRNSKITKAIKNVELLSGELSLERVYKSRNLTTQKIELYKVLKELNDRLPDSSYVRNANLFLTACIELGVRERGEITKDVIKSTGLTIDQIKIMHSRHLNPLFRAYLQSKEFNSDRRKIA
jgi:hypothetical protein